MLIYDFYVETEIYRVYYNAPEHLPSSLDFYSLVPESTANGTPYTQDRAMRLTDT